MSHLHIPDGLLPIWLLALGFGITGLILAYCIFKLKSEDYSKILPKLAIMSALVIVAMSVPLGFLPYHLNLTVLVGIVLGPWLGFTAAFIINLILSLVGHGGITVIGVNTLLIGLEVFAGYYLFHVIAKKARLVWAAGLATGMTLLLSTVLMISFVGMADFDLNQTTFGHKHEESATHNEGEVHDESEAHLAGEATLSLSRFALLVLPITTLGAFIESLVNVVIVRFLLKVRSDVLPVQELSQDIPEEDCSTESTGC